MEHDNNFPQGPQFDKRDHQSTGQWVPPTSSQQASGPSLALGFSTGSPLPRPPKKKIRARTYIVIGAAAVIGIGALGAGTAHHPANGVSAASSSSTTSTSSDSTATQASQISVWWDGGASAEATAIADADTAMQQGVQTYQSTGDSSGLRTACQDLSRAAAEAELDPPPVGSVATPWATAMADYARAGTECVDGIDSSDASLLGDAASSLTDGTTAIDQASAALSSVKASITG